MNASREKFLRFPFDYQFLFRATSRGFSSGSDRYYLDDRWLAASEIFALSNNCAVPKNIRDLWTFGNSLPEYIHIKISERNANLIAMRCQVFIFRFSGRFERSLLMIRANLSRKPPLEKFERSHSGSSYMIK